MAISVYLSLAAFWAVWCYPFVFRSTRGPKRASITARGPTAAGLLLETLAIILAFVFRLPRETAPGWERLTGSAMVGVVSVMLAWSAVRHLGKQLRVTAGLYDDHELVRTGPYRIVRHPIYAGLLGGLICTMLAITRVEWMAPLAALFIVGTEIRVRTEDSLLESRFGDDFRRYRQRVRAYIPFVR